jgi:hypothetical protein
MRKIGVIGDGVTLRPASHIKESWLHHYQLLNPNDEFTGYFYDGDMLDIVNEGDTLTACLKAMLDVQFIVLWMPAWSHEVITHRPGASVHYVYYNLLRNLKALTAGYDDAVYVIDAPRPMTYKNGVYRPSHFWGTLRHNHQIHVATKARCAKTIKIAQALDHEGQLYRLPNEITRTTEHGAFTVANAVNRAINGTNGMSLSRLLSAAIAMPEREHGDTVGGLQPLPA